MRYPAKAQTQQAQLTPELEKLQAEAKKLYTYSQPITKEYLVAAEKFNAAVVAHLGKENCGFLLLVTK